jgi:putative membrane protein
MLLLGVAFATYAQSGSREPPLVANAADSQFMTRAAADSMAEIHMGQMALEKSADAKVKQLAQRIVADHTDAYGKLRALAQAKQVALPAAATDEARRSADAMTNLDAKKFDKEWTAAMVKDHQKAVELFTAEIRKTQDPEVRAFAEKTLPTLKTHLELAQHLSTQLDLPDARDEAMNHNMPMDGSFARAQPATAATARVPATAASSANVDGRH